MTEGIDWMTDWRDIAALWPLLLFGAFVAWGIGPGGDAVCRRNQRQPRDYSNERGEL